MSTAPRTRILYMEDDPGLGRLLQKRLARMEFDVDVAPNGEEGLRACQETVYDLVLVDHNMPGLTGIEVIGSLSRQKEHPPLIMLTGEGDEDLAVRALKSGASDYLVKDVEGAYLDHLPTAISSTLTSARLAAEKQRIEQELLQSERFNRAILDSLTAHVAILDQHGAVIRVNSAWQRFARENGMEGPDYGTDDNYLEICDTASGPFAAGAKEAANGIRAVMEGRLPDFQHTYECSSADTRRWFTMRVTRVEHMDPPRVVVAHEDVSELKSTEEALRRLSQKDGLTGLANRRHFDETLKREWARATRNQSNLSLLMLDIDQFKLYNDRYGHLKGDDCIRKVAQVLESELKRSTDLAARFGGEEFVVLLPDTGLNGALHLAVRIKDAIQELAIPHEASDAAPVVTVSIGAGTNQKLSSMDPDSLVHAADIALYKAKQGGRNTVAQA